MDKYVSVVVAVWINNTTGQTFAQIAEKQGIPDWGINDEVVVIHHPFNLVERGSFGELWHGEK